MRAVVQRVSRARVIAEGCVTGEITAGLMILLGVGRDDTSASQFTLYGDARGQRRPSFIVAAPPEQAKKLYEEFSEALRRLGVTVATGVFQAMMSVELVNEGPVTILLDSYKTF